MMRMMMKSAIAGAVASLATAAAPGIAGAAPCITTTLNNWLVAGFSCTVTTAGVTDTFSNFSYSPDGFANVPATVVGVGPSPTTAGPGILFNAFWQNTGATTLDALINFNVTTTAAGQVISAADLLLDGVVGSVLDVESLSNGTTISSSDNLNHTAAFAGVTTLNVRDDVGVNPGGTISSIDKQFVSIVPPPLPEPASLTILGSALAGLGLLGWRRRKAG